MVTDDIPQAAFRSVVLGLLYWLAAVLSIQLVYPVDTIALFWPPNAIASAALLFSARKHWPIHLTAVALGFLAARLPGALPWPVYSGFCAANIIEILIVAVVVRRFAPEISRETRGRTITVAMLASVPASLASALIGGASVSATVEEAGFAISSIGWFVGDLSGLLLVLPMILAWLPAETPVFRTLEKGERIECLAFAFALLGIAVITFLFLDQGDQIRLTFPYLVFPVLIWGALRLGVRATTTATLIVGLFVVFLTYLGYGPFIVQGISAHAEVAFLETGLIVIALTADFLAVTVEGRKQAEKAARESEERFRVLFQALPVPVVVVDDDRRILRANEVALKAERVLDRERTVDRRSGDFLGCIFSLESPRGCGYGPHCGKCGIRQQVLETSESGRAFRQREQTLTVRGPDGPMTLEFLVSTARIAPASKDIAIVIENVSGLRTVERELSASQARLQAVFEGVDAYLFLKDEDFRYTHANRALAESYGSTVENLIGHTDTNFCTPSEAAVINEMDRKVLAGQTVQGEFNRLIMGRKGTVETSKVPLRDEVDNIVGICGFSRDITERKRMEEMLRRANRLQAVGQLTGGVAHEFNNIFQVIQGILGYAMKKGGGELANAPIETVLSAVQRGARITRQLLAYSQQLPLLPEAVSVSETLASMRDQIEESVGNDIRVELRPEENTGEVVVDAAGFRTAILNLVLNARAAMPEGGNLAISVRNTCFEDGRPFDNDTLPPGRYVEIAVADTGCGMSEEILNQAFEPFFTTRGVGQGTGLGLSMVFGFARQSNGTALLESEVGKGTTARILLPVADAGTDAKADSREPALN